MNISPPNQKQFEVLYKAGFGVELALGEVPNKPICLFDQESALHPLDSSPSTQHSQKAHEPDTKLSIKDMSVSSEEVSTVEALLPLFRIFIEIDRRLKRQERERGLGVIGRETAEITPTPETVHF